MAIDMAYAGSRTKSVPVSKGVDEVTVELLNQGNPALDGDPNYLSAQAPNPFQNLMPGTSLNSATISRSQSLRPYPQFTGFSMSQLNDGQLWYNCFQMSFEKRYSKRLTALAVAPIHDLPFGPGRKFLTSTNPIVKGLAGGWETIVTTNIQSGDPDGSPTSTNFGKIIRDNGQTNSPRNIQLGIRLIC